MPRKGKSVKVSSRNTNTLKNKVIINIGSNRKASQRGSKSSERSRTNIQRPPPPSNIIYSTVNPSVDPFAVRQQTQSQLDLLRSLQTEISQLKPRALMEPLVRPLHPIPSLVSQDLSEIKYNSGEADVKRFPISEAPSNREMEVQTDFVQYEPNVKLVNDTGSQTDPLPASSSSSTSSPPDYGIYDNFDALSGLNVRDGIPNLREIARHYGVGIGGSKAELITRILTHLSVNK